MKKWKINQTDENKAAELSRKCDLTPLTVKVMLSRGLDSFDKIVDFFTNTELADPFEILDMDKAVAAINKAVDDYDLICIYGDYDCDGVTATAILFGFLQNIGANVMYYIPERDQGYGMNMNAIDELCEQGVKLIVTVDNGISAIPEAEHIYELGMKLVVTDHHQPLEELPRAEAVVDPHRKDCTSSFKELSGAGVAMKLCAALMDGDLDTIIEQFSDICALGTVADIVPLVGENREIVKQGIMYMKNTENPGLDLLMNKASVRREELSSGSIGFQLAPRINASGRFGSPITAVKALLTEDPDEAEIYVDELIRLNDLRRNCEAEITKAIMHYIDSHPETLYRRVLVLAGNGWHHGVIGIVAARLLERYGKPVILISIEKDGIARGSARSIKGFNIFECLKYTGELLDHFGGHECAGGLTIQTNKIPKFTEMVYEYASKFEIMPAATLDCDLALRPEDITVENIFGLKALEPFGAENTNPVFAVLGARIENIISLTNGKHTKLELSFGSVRFPALMFGTSPESLNFVKGDIIDLGAQFEVNSFNGVRSVTAKAMDCRPHGINQDRYFSAKDCYEKFMLGSELPKEFLKRIDPDRNELVAVYKSLGKYKKITSDELYMQLRSKEMNYCKLRIIIDAFVQTGLAVYTASDDSVSLLPVSGKVDLMSADVLVRLKSMI